MCVGVLRKTKSAVERRACMRSPGGPGPDATTRPSIDGASFRASSRCHNQGAFLALVVKGEAPRWRKDRILAAPRPAASSGLALVEELLVFGRALQGRRRGLRFDRGGDRVEVARAHLPLVLDRRE